MSTAFRRIILLQRQILKTIRADARKAIGPQSRELKRYYEAYKREFRGHARHSTKEELLSECAKADIILLGDYHTFAQSQRAALRLLRQLVRKNGRNLTLALEMLPTSRQQALDDYAAGKISESQFLAIADYERNWGFPWENFKPLLSFALDNRMELLALNLESGKLQERDAHAASQLASYSAANPGTRLFALYGDLHLARGHIPRFLSKELGHRQLKRRVLTIFQNSESLYWKLAERRMTHAVDVLALGQGRYCIMNAAPWVKLQSYLEWAESGVLLDAEDGGGVPLHEIAHERLGHLAEALRLELPAGIDFSIQTVDDLSFIERAGRLAGLGRDELKSVKYRVLGNRTVYIPQARMIYLASSSVNAISEGVTMAAHAALSGSTLIPHDPREHFFHAVLAQAIAYFGSKVLNHKRKCDLEDDFRLLLERPVARGALPQEGLLRRVAKIVLRHCQAQRAYAREGRYRGRIAVRGPGNMPLFLESARCLGAILGEKLYAAYVEGAFPSVKIEQLFRAKATGARQARALYLKLVSSLHRAPLAHSSKADLF